MSADRLPEPHLDPRDPAQLAALLVAAWGSWGPTLSPECDRIAFLSDRSGVPAVWVQDLPTAEQPDPEPRLVPVADDPAVEVSWSADGAWLACRLATDGGVRTQVWVVRPDGRDARRIAGGPDEHAELGPWTRSGHRVVVTVPGAEGEPTVSRLADPATGALTDLATGELITVLDLSADEEFVIVKDGRRGEQFCVVVDRIRDADHPLLSHPGRGSTERAIIRPEIDDPGTQVAYLVTDAGLPRRQLVATPLGPQGRRTGSGVLAPRDDGELEWLDADDAGHTLLLVWNTAGGGSEIELYDVLAGRGRVLPELDGLVVNGALLSRDGSTVLICVEGPLRPRELWTLEVASMVWSRATAAPPLPELDLVTPSLQFFTGRDGLPLTGWLYRPKAMFGPGPAMLSLHGGPEAQERPVFSPQHQAMVAAGITVFAPNIRGSSGFGRTFVHADDVHGRRGAFDDVLAARDFLLDLGLADPRRIAVTGRSYGGYVTLAMLAFTPGEFACGVDICGMSDLLTFYRDTEPWIGEAAYSKYGHPEHDRVLLEALSPLRLAANIEVPLLVVHGELDTNVPLGEATQLVAALAALGRPVEYLELAGEGHEYRRADSRLELITRLLDFLSRTLDLTVVPLPRR